MKPKKFIVVSVILALMLPASVMAGRKYLVVYINPDNLSFRTGQGSTLEEASRIAAESCGPKCERACYSYDACLALAISSDGSGCWGCNWGNSISEAIAKAQKICRGYNCKCKIVMDECYR
jgi:hypothetical protein